MVLNNISLYLSLSLYIYIYIYIYEILNLSLHRLAVETTLPFSLPVSPSFASCLLPFFGVFHFQHTLGSFPLSNGRGNRRGNGRGNGGGNRRVNGRGKGKGRSHLTAGGNRSGRPARNTMRKCVYGVKLGGFGLTQSNLESQRAG